ncbi:MAG TPA: transporter [Candidatus Saccharimonadales bacterium]|nr:transporter [Candidatus Saccharimonadales bacterium]
MKTNLLQKTLTIGTALMALPALAADVLPSYNLHPNFPVDITDAYALEYQSVSTFGIIRYQRTDSGQNDWLLQPEVKYGFAPKWEADLSIPFMEGSFKGTGGGNIRLGALYNFLDEQDLWPALAVSPQIELPTGRASRGLDIGVTVAATKSLVPYIPGASGDAVHANFSFTHNSGARVIERDHYYKILFGYSRQISDDLVAVADFVHQQTILRNHDENIIEGGVVFAFQKNLSFAGGIGFGLGAESPDVRVTAGVMYKF